MSVETSVRDTAWRTVGRYRVPADTPEAIRWFVDALWAPRSRRERWLGRIGSGVERLSPPLALALLSCSTYGAGRRDSPAADSAAGEAGRRVLERFSGRAVDGARGLAWAGYPGTGRALEFVFAYGECQPRWVLKSGLDRPPRPLGGERERLRRLRAQVGAELAATLPEPLGYAIEAGREWLLLAALPGRNVDADLARAPGDTTRHRRHLLAAARWLGSLHRETSAGADGEIVRAASHGDFWPRNVLLTEDRSRVIGVVDWESAEERIPVDRDLFDFLLSYAALLAPGAGAERAVAAFRLAILDPAALGGAASEYLDAYAAAAGVAPAALEPHFRRYLSELAAGARELRLVSAPEREEVASTWLELFTSAKRSVFSG